MNKTCKVVMLESQRTDGLRAFNPRHLYIISNDDMKRNDWFIKDDSLHRTAFDLKWSGYHKVIASTNNKLKLPGISDSFLNKYIKENDMKNDSNIYVLKACDCDKWVAIDDGSGGYPYLTTLESCNKFYTKARAIDYMSMFDSEFYKTSGLGNFVLQTLHCHTKNVKRDED